MAGVNKVILVGNLGDDPEARSLNNGGEVVNLRVATSENWKDKDGNRQERTEWHQVVIFNENLGRVAKSYLKKGSKVYLEGQIQTRKWTGPVGQRQLFDRGRAPALPRRAGPARCARRRRRAAASAAAAVATATTSAAAAAAVGPARSSVRSRPRSTPTSTTTFRSRLELAPLQSWPGPRTVPLPLRDKTPASLSAPPRLRCADRGRARAQACRQSHRRDQSPSRRERSTSQSAPASSTSSSELPVVGSGRK